MGVAKIFIDNILINVYGLLTNVGKVNFFFSIVTTSQNLKIKRWLQMRENATQYLF